jgi:hypothetical protein
MDRPAASRATGHRIVAALTSVILTLCGCTGLTSSGSALPSRGTESTAPVAATGAPGSLPARTEGPARTPIPGFEDWQVINPQGVRVSVEEGGLVLDLIGPLLWFNEERGVLFYRDVTGDFRATATVRTSKASEPTAPPGQDGTIQLAGLMARTEIPAENYVFIVGGSIGMSTGLETKTTTSSRSVYVQRGLPTGGDAELRLCRIGPTFVLLWRHVDSSEAWTLMSTFERRDMPQTLQVGANIYTDGVPDLVARFEQLMIERLDPGEAC